MRSMSDERDPATDPAADPGAGSPAFPGGGDRPLAYCWICGARIDARAEICPSCGVRQRGVGPVPPATQQPGAVPPGPGSMPAAAAGDRRPPDRVAAGVLAILLGSFGAHRFYLGQVGLGLLYLLFFWTGIPAIVGLVEGILYLTKSDEQWVREHPAGSAGSSRFMVGCLVAITIAGGILLIVLLGALLALLPADVTTSPFDAWAPLRGIART